MATGSNPGPVNLKHTSPHMNAQRGGPEEEHGGDQTLWRVFLAFSDRLSRVQCTLYHEKRITKNTHPKIFSCGKKKASNTPAGLSGVLAKVPWRDPGCPS